MDKILWLLFERYLYTARTTVGRLFFEYVKDYVQYPQVRAREYFCYSLEDTARPANIKVYAETCLPGGLECKVGLFENDHYKKTIIFYTEADGFTIKAGELTWTYCLAHNGATFEHTAGCTLVGANLNPALYQDQIITREPFIYNGKKDDLRVFVEKKMAEGYEVKARFTNFTQLQ
jgi:hypothetical protein